MTAYELRISDGSSDVCSSDLDLEGARLFPRMRKERQRKGGKTMSQPFSRFLHPFDVSRHPSLEPEVKRAILASWASDRCAVRNQPAMRKPPGAERAVSIDDILAAMHDLDKGSNPAQSLQ